MKLWQIGLFIFILAGLLNTVLMNVAIIGLPRELARLASLVGITIFFIGLFKKRTK